MPKHCAFFVEFDKIVDELVTPASIIPLRTTDAALCGVPFETEALWDTGATATCIKPALWERLKLRPLEYGRASFAGVGDDVEADVTLVTLLLPSGLEIKCWPVYVVDFPGDMEILIGMDIIEMGDFAVCNANKETAFSFAIPPFPDKVNFADKAEAANRKDSV